MSRLEILGVIALLADAVESNREWVPTRSGDYAEVVPVEVLKDVIQQLREEVGLT